MSIFLFFGLDGPLGSNLTLLRVAAFKTTESELKDIAAAAIIGFKSPSAAMGMAAVL